MRGAVRRGVTIVAAGAAVLAVPGAAGGQSLGPQASVTLTPGAAVRECLVLDRELRPCGLLGARKATVAWTSGCAAPYGEDARATKVDILVRPPGPTQWEYGAINPSDELGDLPLPATGSATFLLAPGWSVYAAAVVTCTDSSRPPSTPAPVDEPEGGPSPAPSPGPRSEQATAQSAPIAAPPRLVAVRRTAGSYCLRPPRTQRSVEGKLQAGRTSWVRQYVRFATNAQHPVVGRSGSADVSGDDAARIRLYARGAGVGVQARPTRKSLEGFARALEVVVRPKRAGTVRLWATIDGVRTNAKTLPVVRGC